ncbi:MAG: hypothetical protein DRO93_10805, partial [Candidatus Thorarchaeota archaeon]
EIYQEFYKQYEEEKSIHISTWPEAILIDDEKEKTGEIVKNYISQVRAWKSEQGIALNAPIKAVVTYGSKEFISKIKPSALIIKSTLKYPKNHEFIIGKPEIEEKISNITPVYSKIGPTFKENAKKLITYLNENKEEIIQEIEKTGDLKISCISGLDIKSDEKLIRDGYIQVEKQIQIKGKKDSKILSFDDFYLEIKK